MSLRRGGELHPAVVGATACMMLFQASMFLLSRIDQTT
jgi:hypothetical protein